MKQVKTRANGECLVFRMIVLYTLIRHQLINRITELNIALEAKDIFPFMIVNVLFQQHSDQFT